MKHNNNNNRNNNNNNGNQLKRIYVLPSGTLSLNDIRRTDAGIYQCIATNTEGSETLEIQLSVMEALTVQILPTQQTVDLGKSTDLVCTGATANKSIFLQGNWMFGVDFDEQKKLFAHTQNVIIIS